MNWKHEAEEKLRLYASRKQAIASMEREMALDEGGLDGLVRLRELQNQRDRAAIQVELVEFALEALDVQERQILDRLYIHPVKNGVDWLCQELGCEVASVYRRRDKALRHFTVAMYGFLE